MVATDLNDAPPSAGPGPQVVLTDGDDASGLASMLAGLLADNLRDFRGRSRVAGLARGAVVLRASDHDLDVTVSFGQGRVEITDGAAPGVTVVAGPWLAMAQLCSGQLPPLRALREGQLALTPGRHLPAAAAAGFVLSVPASFYEEAGSAGTGSDDTQAAAQAAARRQVMIAAGVGAGAALVVGIVVLRRRRRR